MVSLAVVGLTAVYESVVQLRKVDWMPGAILEAGGIFGGAAYGAQATQPMPTLVFEGKNPSPAGRGLRDLGAVSD